MNDDEMNAQFLSQTFTEASSALNLFYANGFQGRRLYYSMRVKEQRNILIFPLTHPYILDSVVAKER